MTDCLPRPKTSVVVNSLSGRWGDVVTRRNRWNGDQIENLSQTGAETPAATCNNHPVEQSTPADRRHRGTLTQRPCRTAHLPAIPRPTHLDDASPMSNLPPVSHQSPVTPIRFNSMTGNLADHILQDVGRLSFSRNLEIPLSNAVNLMGNARRNWLGLRLDFSTELRWAYNLTLPNHNAYTIYVWRRISFLYMVP